MKRIDSVNARPDENGLGKAGFSDNADLPGQDATYITPDWFNTVQEELCNLIELRGISLDPESKRQLYDLLSTQTDLEALATEIENNFIRKSQIIDNLTTNDATKPVSAKQAKKLQDEKLDKTALNNTLTSTLTTQALTAAQGKVLNDQAFGVGQTEKNVTAVRSLNTVYTNPTDKTITISLSGGSGVGCDLYINDKLFAQFTGSFSHTGAYAYIGNVTWLIPPHAEYELKANGSKPNIWSEIS